MNRKTGSNRIRTNPLFFSIVFFFTIFLFISPPATAQNIIIKFYQEHISPADGDRCPMYPSCSTYASKSIEKHGWFMGWVMTCDRLVRCGRDEVRFSKKINVNNRRLIYDPVETNVSWWFEKEKKQ